MANVNGNEFGNFLEGTNNNDTIRGFEGDDDLLGRGGRDTIFGGDGDDYINGEGGNDVLFGDDGDDDIDSGDGQDTLYGGEGNDDLVIDGEGDKTLYGGNGQDEVEADGRVLTEPLGIYINLSTQTVYTTLHNAFVDPNNLNGVVRDSESFDYTIESIEDARTRDTDLSAILIGSDERNRLRTEGANDVIFGLDGSDFIQSAGGDDTLYGGGSGDVFAPGSGNDFIYGGRGGSNDWWNEVDYYEDDDNSDDLNPGNGITATWFSEFDGQITDWNGNLDRFFEIDLVGGTFYADTFNGTEGRQVFSGIGGGDTIFGGAGDYDMVDYRPLNWLTSSNSGIVANLVTGTVQDGMGNTDRISGIEEVRGTDQADSITGDDNDNWLGDGGERNDPDNGADNDSIYGGGGNDHIELTWGNDIVDGGDGDEDVLRLAGSFSDHSFASTGANSFQITGAWGTKTVSNVEFVEFREDNAGWISVESLLAGASDGDDTLGDADATEGQELSGLGGDDTLIGGDGRDWLDGGDGNDSLSGGDEFDDLYGGPGNDSIDGGFAGDFIRPGAGTDTIDGGAEGGVNDWWNELAYDERYENPGNGITVVLTSEGEGTVIDWNGDTDSFTRIDAIRGTFYSDSITGSDGRDIFQPLGGSDTIDLGGGDRDLVDYRPLIWRADSYDGIVVDLVAGTVTGGAGGTDTLIGVEEIRGTDKADTFTGNDEDNRFEDGARADDPNHAGDNDFMYGGGGNDVFYVTWGFDTIDGGDGDGDLLVVAGSLSDYTFLSTSDTSFQLTSGFGTKIVSNVEYVESWDDGDGWVSVDSLRFPASSGDDALGDPSLSRNQEFNGEGGNDKLTGGSGNDRLRGDEGNDTITGGAGSDDLFGGDDDDTIITGDGTGDDGEFDYVQPGEGNDTITGDGPDSMIDYIDLGFGVRVDLTAGTTVDIATGGTVKSDSFTSIDNVGGTDQDDELIGGNPANDDFEYFQGGGGDDSIVGGSGSDMISYYWDDGTLGVTVDLAAGTATDTFGDTDTFSGIEWVDGSNEDDVLSGADGEQIFAGFAGADVIDGRAGETDLANYERDEVRGGTGGIDADLQAGTIVDGFGDTDTVSNIEWVVGTSFADKMVGANGFGVTLEGKGGADEIDGGRMNDVIEGGDGHDDLHGQRGADEVYGGIGNDIVKGGVGSDTLYGEDGNDNLSGGRGNDMMYGGDGINKLVGQRGNDMLEGGDQRDILNGGGGEDMLTGNGGNDRLKGGSRDDVLYGGDGPDKLYGNGGNDSMFGGAGDDLINAGGDDDYVVGGSGNDRIKAGNGADTFVFVEDGDIDRILDLNIADDTLIIESAYWSEGETAQDLVDDHGSVDQAENRVVLDFGDGDLILLDGLTSLDGLAGAIEMG